jgi:hypothetical protein
MILKINLIPLLHIRLLQDNFNLHSELVAPEADIRQKNLKSQATNYNHIAPDNIQAMHFYALL